MVQEYRPCPSALFIQEGHVALALCMVTAVFDQSVGVQTLPSGPTNLHGKIQTLLALPTKGRGQVCLAISWSSQSSAEEWEAQLEEGMVGRNQAGK